MKATVLSVGIPEFDDDHLQFIELCQRLRQSDAPTALLKTMIGSANAHMQREERMLLAARYDRHCRFSCELHLADHQRTRSRLRAMAASPERTLARLDDIADMQHGHILRHDLKFRSFLVEIGGEANAVLRRSIRA